VIALMAVALVGAICGTALARTAAWMLGMIDRPNPIVPQHKRAVAHLGGIGIAIGLLAAVVTSALLGIPLTKLPANTTFGFFVGAIGYLLLGTYDDARPLRPLSKVAGQLVIAVVAIVCSGIGGPLEVAIASLWLVGVTNAFNLTDVCDGLVGSLATIALLVIAVVSPSAAPIALVLAAASVGFLVFNWTPASIFLGDGGSHLLGFSVGYLWLSITVQSASWYTAIAACLGVALFLFELVFLVVVRRRRGIPFWRGSPDHLALRMQAAGWSKSRTIHVAIAVAAGFGGTAIWVARTESLAGIGFGVALIALTACAVTMLYHLEPIPKAGRAREEESR
jgi:UDP-GlcNAc:undecaprenyl-phosphate GlcNAc-1-phosphate transferase